MARQNLLLSYFAVQKMAFTDLVLLSYVVLCVYAWRIPQFTDLVVFGDSWSDAGRLQYIIAHNGSMPPVGWTFSEVRNIFPQK